MPNQWIMCWIIKYFCWRISHQSSYYFLKRGWKRWGKGFHKEKENSKIKEVLRQIWLQISPACSTIQYLNDGHQLLKLLCITPLWPLFSASNSSLYLATRNWSSRRRKHVFPIWPVKKLRTSYCYMILPANFRITVININSSKGEGDRKRHCYTHFLLFLTQIHITAIFPRLLYNLLSLR